MSRATEDSLDGLHSLVSESLTEQIKAYRSGNVKDEEGMTLPMPPALLAQALKFLKDNGIDSPVRALKVADTLAAKMPEFDPEDSNVIAMRNARC